MSKTSNQNVVINKLVLISFMENTITLIVSSGVVAAITSSFFSYFSNKKLSVQQRTMEIRKELYTKIINQMSFFITTVKQEDTDNAMNDFLKYFRETQLWGSDNVVKNFKTLLDLMNEDFSSKEKERNVAYKELILSMRKDILGKTSLTEQKIDIRGVEKK